ncbi:MAG TPA: hypothetical protein VGO47_12265 [Chlamydiales bacterium]|nr:hypothetical protein [Chlamydiales bacterium]
MQLAQLPSLRALAIAHPSCDGRTYRPNPFYDALASDTGLLLQDLLIDFVTRSGWYESRERSFAHFFETTHLYHLRRFTVHGRLRDSVRQELEAFLSRHSKLEALWLDELGHVDLKESNINLPNLKALQFYRVPPLKIIPEEILKNLKHLCIPLDKNISSGVLDNAPHLESCYLVWVSNISQLSTKVPLLQRLDFRHPMNRKVRIVHFKTNLTNLV